MKEVARNLADEAAEDFNISYESVGLMDDPANTLVDYAADEDARYVVLSPRKCSPTGEALFGSVAQSVLLNAECPVMMTIRE